MILSCPAFRCGYGAVTVHAAQHMIRTAVHAELEVS